MAIFQSAWGDVNVRLREQTQHQEQAFNQADSYLLELLKEQGVREGISCINDSHGALASALEPLQPKLYHDLASYSQSLALNLQGSIPAVTVTEDLHHSFHACALLKLPKNLLYFRYLLSQLATQSDCVIVAGMQKYWPKAFYAIAYDYFDEVEVFPGVKKAKAMRLRRGKKSAFLQEDFIHALAIDEFQIQLRNYPGVFCYESLDIGSRFFLENFPDLSGNEHVLDLACGNGLLGIYNQLRNPATMHSYIDDSHLAISACKASLKANGISDNYQLFHNNSLDDLRLAAVDSVLCNPPFHQQHSISDHVARNMIRQSHEVLRPSGCLYLIGNRHLHYGKILHEYFNNVTPLATNNKFTLYQARKS